MNEKSEKYTSLFHYWSRESIHNEDNEEMNYLFPTRKGGCYEKRAIIIKFSLLKTCILTPQNNSQVLMRLPERALPYTCTITHLYLGLLCVRS